VEPGSAPVSSPASPLAAMYRKFPSPIGPVLSQHPGLTTTGALAAVAAVLVGCLVAFGSSTEKISVLAGEVSNAKQELLAAEQAWRADLQNEQVRVAKNARCYFVKDATTKLTTNQIYCGAVRRADAADGHVWDVFAFETTPSGNGKVVGGPPEASESAVATPPGALVRPDGGRPPKDAARLALPDLPTAEPDQVVPAIKDGLQAQKPIVLGDTSKLVAPKATLALTSLGTVATQRLADGKIYRPAPGQVFRAISFTLATDSAGSDSRVPLDPTVFLASNGKRIKLDSQNTGVIAEIPEAGGAKLILSAGGHDQSIDLNTGKRDPDPAADPLYSAGAVQAIEKPFAFGPLGTGDLRARYQLTIKSLVLTPFSDEKGWAPAGKVWVRVEFDDKASNDGYHFNADNAKYDGWTLTVGAVTAKPSQVIASTGFFNTTPSAVEFAVPAGTSALHLKAPTRVLYKRYDAPSQSVTFAAAEVDVKFS
jgi:outer membrane murein-binding lipoprotein Lpp